MRRRSIFFLIPPLVFLLAVGCGGGGEKPITIWEQMDPEERDIFAHHIEVYEQEHPGVLFEVSHYSTDDLRTQFQTAGMAGGGPDLVFGPSDQVGPFSVMQLIQPIDELLTHEELNAFRPDALDTLDGHIWAVPDQLGNHLILVWNSDLISAAPMTLDELIETAKNVTVDENGDGVPERYGLVFNVSEPFWAIPFLTAFGGWIMDSNNKPTLDSPAMVEALQFLKDLRYRYGIMPAECDYELADTMFKEGRAAMIINGPWSWGAYKKAGIHFGLARLPREAKSGRWPAPMVSSKGYSIGNRVKGDRLTLVLDALNSLTSVENQIDFAMQLGTLPSRQAAYADTRIQNDPILRNSLAQVEVGRKMPVITEMRAIWDIMRPAVQSVWNGTLEPAEAARQMQEHAVAKINEMKG
ncbi:MAG: extracellular solute-binding protein [Candidatus Eisenbacteria bacterium]|uniref:Extracellular solute-binding protein n=1 Tax=Eiseniibacteriota bacterium TaxID=2212470 RepID=A0A948RXL5_UNCEI|nr:extracellular solute-binding protein [Candidatus Eisenbacteria bacterium]MBU1950442.1 extracellular solute-binding protein [Candidatus Eisenbacteria bacterium]MBU2690109.1 extracellular solute-binding protein [Candidatus Eisenbacteria bacterium]